MRAGPWFEGGSADSTRILAGELWRSVTALCLHADVGHVASNALFGALFLVVIALLPDLVSAGIGTQKYMVQFLGGTGILIVVGVGLDIIQKVESYLLMHHYGGFLGGSGRVQGRR